MGFGGSALAMIQTLKNNAKQLASRNKYFDKKTDSQSVYGKFIDHKKMSPKEFEEFKKKLKTEASLQHKKVVITYGIVISLTVGLAVYFLYFY
ncbi:hypothetical protein INR76_09355 [Marixanthomonas sp. SCSIO 43207]|uniref:hypothetical protein n=1 Tax=Marixanthomonas sp. SCSIO 43207 TaxID=2779360 RepID=UPI001CA7FF80|nr:hypothetical protein [Marixanthomonas sp. SCSIO 43207]UAB80323.1 hypothetical protein INR76_09355 [Marixanthomonas sp. SCSIO 43207]